jgi:hypothetical protein
VASAAAQVWSYLGEFVFPSWPFFRACLLLMEMLEWLGDLELSETNHLTSWHGVLLSYVDRSQILFFQQPLHWCLQT